MERMDMCDVISAHESHGFYYFSGAFGSNGDEYFWSSYSWNKIVDKFEILIWNLVILGFRFKIWWTFWNLDLKFGELWEI